MSCEDLEWPSLRSLLQIRNHRLLSPDPLNRLSRLGAQGDSAASNKSLCKEFLDSKTYDSDEFQNRVARKTNEDFLKRSEAEREVTVDFLIRQKENKENALFYVLEADRTEPNILVIVNTLLSRGANPSCKNKNDKKKTPLHYATEKGFVDVVKALLFKDARPDSRDEDKTMPVHIAVKDVQNDDIATLLLLSMDNETVRSLFTVPDNAAEKTKAELSLHDLIEKKNMEQTVLAVLSCMMDPLGNSSSVRVHYHALDADEDGRSPGNKHFNRKSRSCLHLMSKGQHTDFVYHDAVRLLLKRKWLGYARRSFLFNAAMFAFFETMLCVGAVLSSMTDPTGYTEPLQIVRAVAEFVFVLAVGWTLILEINQMKKHKLEYFLDKFNLVGLLSCVFLLLVIPLRAAGLSQQWPVYSMGFLLWTLRIFNFAAVFRTMGAYSQVLWRIMLQDFPQFIGVFAIILIAFSGSFVLALRGEDSLGVHQETSNFWETLFTGIRILIEGQPVLDYYGPDGYTGLSCLLMVTFLGMSCVVLLSILIAQLSDTYQNVQSDAHRQLELNRAWIITRVELHSVYHRRYRTPHRIGKYKPYEDITNPKEVLKKWDSPQLSEINRHVKDIKDIHETHSLKLRHVNKRMRHLEEKIGEILKLVKDLNPKPSKPAHHSSSPQTQLSITLGSESRTEDTEDTKDTEPVSLTFRSMSEVPSEKIEDTDPVSDSDVPISIKT